MIWGLRDIGLGNLWSRTGSLCRAWCCDTGSADNVVIFIANNDLWRLRSPSSSGSLCRGSDSNAIAPIIVRSAFIVAPDMFAERSMGFIWGRCFVSISTTEFSAGAGLFSGIGDATAEFVMREYDFSVDLVG